MSSRDRGALATSNGLPRRRAEQVRPQLMPRYTGDPGELCDTAFRDSGPRLNRRWSDAELLGEIGDAKLLPEPDDRALRTCHHFIPGL